MKYKFKVGDKVIGNDNLKYYYINGIAVENPKEIIGTVTDVWEHHDGNVFLDIKTTKFEAHGIYARRFDLLKSNKQSFYNDKTVVYFNLENGKMGVAVNGDKKFDLEKGLAFAMLKTYGVTYSQFKEQLDNLVDKTKKNINKSTVKGEKNDQSSTKTRK